MPARIAPSNVDKRPEADQYAREVEYVELTVEKDFETHSAQAMYFPHMNDQFPHLRGLLPQEAQQAKAVKLSSGRGH